MTRKTIIWLVCAAVSAVVCAALIVGAVFLFGKKDDKGLDSKDIGKVLGLTGQAIESGNAKIVNNFNEYWMMQQTEAEGQAVGSNSLTTDLSEMLGDILYEINYAESFYAISEYFNEFLGEEFLNNTYLVQQIVYDQTIYARFTLGKDNLHIEIYDVNNQKNETEEIYIYFSNNRPTRLVFNSSEEYDPIYGYGNFYRNAVIDFRNQMFSVTTLDFESGTTAEVNTFDKDFYKENLNYCERYEIYFDNLFNPDAQNFKIDGWMGLSDEEVDLALGLARKMDIFAGTTAKTNLDIENAIIFRDGTKCINYAFNKYVITVDEQSGYLKTRQSHGLPEEIVKGVDMLRSVMEGNYEIPSGFDSLTYEKDGTDYQHNLLENVELNNLIASLDEWYQQEYDSEKYYYETEEYKGINIIINVGLFAGVIKTNNSLECFVISNDYTETKIQYFEITTNGISGFELALQKYKVKYSDDIGNVNVWELESTVFESSIELYDFTNNYYENEESLGNITSESYVRYRLESFEKDQTSQLTYYYAKNGEQGQCCFISNKNGTTLYTSWNPWSIYPYSLYEALNLLGI